MKKLLLLALVLGLVWVACRKKEPNPTVGKEPTMGEKAEDALQVAADKTKAAADTVAEKSKQFASDAKEIWDRKRVEWKLTDTDIKSDLEKTGRVIRENSATASEKLGTALDNARIAAVIKGKFVADSDLSALKIDVDVDRGVVTLRGTVKSFDLLGRATALALDTTGVKRVVALLRVSP